MPSSEYMRRVIVMAMLATFAANAAQIVKLHDADAASALVALISMCSTMAALPFVTSWFALNGRERSMEDRKTVEMKASEFDDMCINAERYAIGRGNHVSEDCAKFIERHAGDLGDRAKYVIARDIKCERQTCGRIARMTGEPTGWHGGWSKAWDKAYDALEQDVKEDYS